MADVFSKEKRSAIMSLVKGRGNEATELRLAQIFRSHGIVGWRRNSTIFGKPDFVFPRYRLAVFVDGCFWHGCPSHSRTPSSNQNFWKKKLEKNKIRDRLVGAELRKAGWRVVRIWQHELRAPRQVARRITQFISDQNFAYGIRGRGSLTSAVSNRSNLA